MTNPYTAIYIDSWMTGSHRNTITKFRRIEQREGKTVGDMLEREGIADCTVYLFHGHPSLQGERNGHC